MVVSQDHSCVFDQPMHDCMFDRNSYSQLVLQRKFEDADFVFHKLHRPFGGAIRLGLSGCAFFGHCGASRLRYRDWNVVNTLVLDVAFWNPCL